MTEWEKAQAGYLYDANYDQEIVEARTRCADLCYEFNSCKPSDTEGQRALLGQILGKMGKDPVITAPFYCDYGFNISVGDNFYTNHNCTILDGAKVEIGDNVFIAPNCVLSTAGHALDSEQRSRGLEIALPIKVGNNVWIGANVTVLPGVTIGDDTVTARKCRHKRYTGRGDRGGKSVPRYAEGSQKRTRRNTGFSEPE